MLIQPEQEITLDLDLFLHSLVQQYVQPSIQKKEIYYSPSLESVSQRRQLQENSAKAVLSLSEVHQAIHYSHLQSNHLSNLKLKVKDISLVPLDIRVLEEFLMLIMLIKRLHVLLTLVADMYPLLEMHSYKYNSSSHHLHKFGLSKI